MKNKIRDKAKPSLRPLPPGVPFSNYNVLLATWFGCGRLRPGSGTWGSLGAIPLGYAIQHFTGIIGLAVATVIMMVAGTVVANFYGKKTGTVDDQGIVVDEVVGMWIAALPAEGNVGLWVTAFLLFRLFDIIKPWPASFYDNRSRGGFDVMMDDVVAGFYAMLAVASAALPVLLQK